MTDPPSGAVAPSPAASEAASDRTGGSAAAGTPMRELPRGFGALSEDDSPEIVVRALDSGAGLEVQRSAAEEDAASRDEVATGLAASDPAGAHEGETARPPPLGTARPASSTAGSPSVWARAEPDPLVRLGWQRGWLHGVTALVLLVGLAALLVAVTPSLARTLTSGRTEPAMRGVARAARLAGWARPPIEPPSAPSAEPGAGRGTLPGFDPLGGSHRSSSIADQLAAREQARGRAGGGAASAPALRLGVIRERSTVRELPAPDGHELGELREGELVVVGAGPDGWALVAGTSGDHSVIGWVERDRVVLQ